MNFPLKTPSCGLFDIMDMAKTALERSGVTSGIMLISVPHSTAALTVISPWDVKGLEDVDDELRRLVPTRVDFKHQHDTPQDAAGHIKAGIIGHSRSFYIEDGRLGVGHSQKVFFWEFDGPRDRTVQIKIVAG